MPGNDLVETVARLLPRVARTAAVNDVHKLRTSIRRLEARQTLGRRWKRLRQRAGRVRDLDVQMDLLRQLPLGRESGRRGLIESMRAERERLAEKLRRGLGAGQRRKLRARLRAWAPDPPPTHSGLLQDFAAVDRGYPRLGAGSTETELHSFRKDCKRLRYRAEAAGETGLAAEFERVQDALGSWHDWGVLANRARAHAEPREGDPGHHGIGPALLAALQNAVAAHLETALGAVAALRAELHGGAQRRPPGWAAPASAKSGSRRASA